MSFIAGCRLMHKTASKWHQRIGNPRPSVFFRYSKDPVISRHFPKTTKTTSYLLIPEHWLFHQSVGCFPKTEFNTVYRGPSMECISAHVKIFALNLIRALLELEQIPTLKRWTNGPWEISLCLLSLKRLVYKTVSGNTKDDELIQLLSWNRNEEGRWDSCR